MNAAGAAAFSLRVATAADAGIILDFIRRLAEYEKLAHLVVASEELLCEELFGPRAHAEVLLGFEQEQAVGFAVYFHNFSTFLGRKGIWLEDLFVLPEKRGCGYGKKMLLELGRIAFERGCGRFEWAVLDWNAPSIDFYKSLGAVALDDWTIFRVTGGALEDLARRAGDQTEST
jgi:GNAT superfamily N-acetyltransferase